MFKNIAVAFDESPEAARALNAALHLATALNTGVHVITVAEELRAYTAYGVAGDRSILRTLGEDRSKFYADLQIAPGRRPWRRVSRPQRTCWMGNEWMRSFILFTSIKSTFSSLGFTIVLSVCRVSGARYTRWPRRYLAVSSEFIEMVITRMWYWSANRLW